ncbi:HD domain-containing protein [Gillisia sp. M10.2A]|uniref:HD domain-containing protein n=1 Tax=Gillisia lutea TaxID=2909668 RepID=A0ABS9EF84_9FLAO|nr:HD domain-containing protein [Gillisia lutea]MCF4101530.1 HD domain-containing protein [Gillisia lutea]
MAFSFLKGLSRSNIVAQTQEYCIDFLNNSRCKSLPFHSVQHTQDVYKYVKTIANYEEVFGADLEPILIAALFHDTGMAETYKDHEDKSVVFAMDYLEKHNYPKDKMEIVKSCIMATKMPQNPKNQAEKIICDADLYHLGLESYIFRNERLRAEWEQFFNRQYSDEEWFAINVEFLENQKYHTWFGKTVLRNRKDLNCKMLKERHEKYKI